MTVAILTMQEREKMRAAGRVAAETLREVCVRVKPGVSTQDIDDWVRADTLRRGGTPAQLGYQGFPKAVCTSKNSVVCHGIPSPREILEDGDIVNIDVTTCFNGYHGDTSLTLAVGTISKEAQHVISVAQMARDAGVFAVRPGVRLGELGAIIENVAKSHGCSVVRELGGHGIGRKMHQAPHIHHHGFSGGMRLRAGMAITIEPMVNLGSAEVTFLEDGWTVVTTDGRLSAQFEHTVLVTEDGHECLTELR